MTVITVTTDFGARDWFVGTMKGVILGINPRATIVDITHEIAGGDIRAGAFALMASCRFFPRGTVHVAVVDPGVGSKRAAITVQTQDYFFVGPDNGVLSLALRNDKVKAIHRLEEEKFFLKPLSHTFHGRDVFAPAAAHLSKGLSIQKLGPPAKDYVKLRWPKPRQQAQRIQGEVVYIDRFGNAITNIPNYLVMLSEAACCVLIGGKKACPVRPFYQSVPKQKPVAVPGSVGFLEIAVHGGSAARRWGLRLGSVVSVGVSHPSGEQTHA